MAKHNDIGVDGELVASEFLESKNLRILDRNWRKPYGEIDIVARETSGKYRFVEVKSVSWETGKEIETRVSHETHNPEDNVHEAKQRRLKRVVQAYIDSKSIEDDWQFDVVAVFLDQANKKAMVRFTEDVILEA